MMASVEREEHIMTSIIAAVAAEHQADLLRAAAERRLAGAGSGRQESAQKSPSVALRLAGADEAQLVRRLAQLDDAPALRGPALLALVDGEPVAALSLLEDRVVANPFTRTQEAVALLRLRARDLRGETRRRRPKLVFRPRAA
jgi:hypothetical protein